jgi:TolB-like protein/tetratricopeptide (TPR) repeat protein
MYAVVGWVLAQIGTTLEETMGLPAWFDGLIVALLLIGFPIALILAWAFELTPEGMVKTEAVPEGESITAETARKLDYAIVFGLVLLVATVLWQSSGTDVVVVDNEVDTASELTTGSAAEDTSIAVLPFADLSPASDQEYFSDGIAEEILNVLVGVKGLEVTSRTSSFQFKGADLGIPAIAKSLNVRHVVEGSVRKSGETIRVTAQLIDADNDKHLWSDTFDRPLTTENIFAIQDEIAKSIVMALSDTLGIGRLEPVEVVPVTENLTAYELFLQARPLFLARLDLDVADELLARALERDPEFSEVWEMRAALQTLKFEYGYSDLAIDEADQLGNEFAERALSLEPRSATAMAVIAKVDGNAAQALRRKVNLASVIADFDKALEIEPRNASALLWRGLRYLAIGDLDASLEDFTKCLEYEIYYTPCMENYYTTLAAMGRDEEAITAYLEGLNTSTVQVGYSHLPLLARNGEEIAFKSATNNEHLLQGWRRHDELWLAYQNPEQDHSELIESVRNYVDNREGAYEEIAEFVVQPLGMGWRIPDTLLLWDASLKHYRQTSEFKTYIRESGVFEYWQAAGFPPQCRPVGRNDFECD